MYVLIYTRVRHARRNYRLRRAYPLSSVAFGRSISLRMLCGDGSHKQTPDKGFGINRPARVFYYLTLGWDVVTNTNFLAAECWEEGCRTNEPKYTIGD